VKYLTVSAFFAICKSLRSVLSGCIKLIFNKEVLVVKAARVNREGKENAKCLDTC
jgi:hypothetical protein